MITELLHLSPHREESSSLPWIWGPEVTSSGIVYRVPCCGGGNPCIEVKTETGVRKLQMTVVDESCWSATDPGGRAGDRYVIRLPDGRSIPDPASRFQPQGVHGPSQVIDKNLYQWTDAHWQRPAFRDLVVYELHIGTFTPEGKFRSAIAKLDHLKALHVSAIELMPVSAFPGRRNWGYDGVFPFAPSAAYGTPDDLRALVDAAHAAGIAVLLDVVYNHFGPDGNYAAAAYPKFFHHRHQTPWGDGINYDGKGSESVRRFVLENVRHWLDDFHLDGLRLDATHTIFDDSERHILGKIAETIQSRGCYAIAEEPRNLAMFTEGRSTGGHGFDAVWADEFHHVTRVGQTGEDTVFYRDFTGSLEELCETMQHGWLYRGSFSEHIKVPRGTECCHLPPSAFVHFISTHDHAGNHALGKRLSHFISEEAYRALSLLICLSPYTPMLFMGQEWATQAPFLFFTDHEPDLGKLVIRGRQEEFAGCPGFENEEALAKIPNPQEVDTFLQSKLPWRETQSAAHAGVLELYRAALRLRHRHACFRPISRAGWSVEKMTMNCLGIRFADEFLLVVNLGGSPGGSLEKESQASLEGGGRWMLALSSNEPGFGGNAREFDAESQMLRFSSPASVLLAASGAD